MHPAGGKSSQQQQRERERERKRERERERERERKRERERERNSVAAAARGGRNLPRGDGARGHAGVPDDGAPAVVREVLGAPEEAALDALADGALRFWGQHGKGFRRAIAFSG